MLRLSLAALLVAGAVGLGGCATYDGGYGYGGAYYQPGVEAYTYNPVVVPVYPYTYQRHTYYPRYGHREFDHRYWDHRNWGTHALGTPAFPRGNYGPGHGAYHEPNHGRGAVSHGAIAGDR